MPDGAKAAHPNNAETGLLDRFRERTRALHVQAERTGIVRDLLRGKASRHGYALLLRNLLPAYQQIEAGLDRLGEAPGIGAIALPALYRSEALGADLTQLHGPDWRRALPLLPASKRYADRVAHAASGDGAGLIAHAFVRFMGDLSGGQILKRLLARSLHLPPAALSFYDFPEIPDIAAFKGEYFAAIERAALGIADLAPVAEEAAEAFRLNIALSRDVAEAAARQN